MDMKPSHQSRRHRRQEVEMAKKMSPGKISELKDSEYRNAVKFFGVSASELGWSIRYLKKEFALYERQDISRAYLCERILTVLFTRMNGLTVSKP